MWNVVFTPSVPCLETADTVETFLSPCTGHSLTTPVQTLHSTVQYSTALTLLGEPGRLGHDGAAGVRRPVPGHGPGQHGGLPRPQHQAQPRPRHQHRLQPCLQTAPGHQEGEHCDYKLELQTNLHEDYTIMLNVRLPHGK